MRHILVIEDDLAYRELLKEKLSSYGRVFTASNFEEGKAFLERGNIDFAFIDLDLEKPLEGLNLLSFTQEAKAAILSSHDSEEVIKEAFLLGAHLYLNKWDFDSYLQEEISSFFRSKNFKTCNYYSTRDEKLKEDIEFVTTSYFKTDLPLMILGESGVGKGQFVKNLIGKESLIHINLTEFSRGTLESELFGHMKGAFTGAHQDKKGIFERADGKVLFLDEIGTLDLALQKKLLRVLEEKEFYPVGSEKSKRSSFRIICATCDDLEKKIEEGNFREDLYYRISSLKLRIPPLRERIVDLDEVIRKEDRKYVKKLFFTEGSMSILRDHLWRGNFRELKTLLKKLRCFEESVISEKLLEKIIDRNEKEKSILLNSHMKLTLKRRGLNYLVKRLEKEAFLWAHKETSGKVNKGAKLLNISKSLYYRIQEESLLSNSN